MQLPDQRLDRDINTLTIDVNEIPPNKDEELPPKKECCLAFATVLRNYAANLKYNEDAEAPFTLSVNYLTELFASTNKQALKLGPYITAMICTVAAGVVLSLKHLAAEKKLKYSEVIEKVAEQLEGSTEVSDNFANTFFALCSIIGRYAPGNLSGAPVYIGAVVVTLVSMLNGFVIQRLLKKVEEMENQNSAKLSKGTKVAISAAKAWTSANDAAGILAIGQTAVGFFSSNAAEKADAVIAKLQIYGGSVYGVFRGAAITPQLWEPLQKLGFVEPLKNGLKKVDWVQDGIGTVASAACQVGIAYGAWSTGYIIPYVAAKALVPAFNTATQAAVAKDPLANLEEGRLLVAGKNQQSSYGSLNQVFKTSDPAQGSKDDSPEIIVVDGINEKEELSKTKVLVDAKQVNNEPSKTKEEQPLLEIKIDLFGDQENIEPSKGRTCNII